MSGPIFRFSKEFENFFGENQDSLEFLSPDKGARDQLGLVWAAQEGGTQFTRKKDGELEVSLITSLDDDKNPGTGAIVIKDVFTVRPNGQVDYQHLSEANGQGQDPEAWQKKAQLFVAAKDKPEALARIKKFIAEQVAPKASHFPEGTLFLDRHRRAFLQKFEKLSVEQKKILDGLRERVKPMELDFAGYDGLCWVKRNGDKIELSLQMNVLAGETSKGWVTNTFVLDPEKLAVVDFQRSFHVLTDQGVKVKPEIASEEEREEARVFMAAMLPYFTQSGGALAPEVLQKKPEASPERPAESTPKELTLQGQAVAGAKTVDIDFDLVASAATERIEQQADESRGWWPRLTGGKPLDVEQEKTLALRVLQAAREKFEKDQHPRKTILRAMADLSLSGEEKRVRDDLLKDYVIRQISNIAQSSDQEIRSQQYLNLLRKDLLGARHRQATALYLAQLLQGVLPADSKAREAAQLVYAELNSESKSRDSAATLELRMPQLLDGLTEPASLAAFAAGGLSGAAVEAAALKGLRGVPALAGAGRLAKTVRTTLGVTAGITLGEAPGFAGSHAVFHSFTHDPSQALSWDRIRMEWAQMSLLFGATRVVHGMTGMVAKGLQTSENSLLKKIFQKTGAGAELQIPVAPMGRYPTLEPQPQFNWFGNLSTGALHHSSGIYTMQGMMNLYPSLGLTFEGEANRPATFMDATLMYGHAVIGFNGANALARGRLQQTITRLRMGSRLADQANAVAVVVPSSVPPSVGGGSGAGKIPNEPVGAAPVARDADATAIFELPGALVDQSVRTGPPPSPDSGSYRDPMATIRDPGDPKQRFEDSTTTKPPSAEQYPGNIPGIQATSRPEGGTVQGMFPAGGTLIGTTRGGEGSQAMFPTELTESGKPARPSAELMAAQGRSLDEISQTIVRDQIPGTPREPEAATDVPKPMTAASAETAVEAAQAARDPRPEVLPSVEDLVPHRGKASAEARGKELGWLQRKVDEWFLDGHYGRLILEAPEVLDAQRSAVHQARLLFNAALSWVERAETKARELAGAQEKNSALNQKVEEQGRELSDKDSKISQIEGDLATLRGDLKKAEDKIKDAEATEKRVRGDYDKMSDEWTGAREQLKNYQKTIKTLEDRIDAQGEFIADLRKILTRLEGLMANGADGPASTLHIAEVMERLQTILTRSQASEQGVERALSDKTQELDAKLEELTRLRSQLRHAEEELQDAKDLNAPLRQGYDQANDHLTSIRRRLKQILPEEEIPDDMTPAIDRLVADTQAALQATRKTTEKMSVLERDREELQKEFEKFQDTAEQALAASRGEVSARDTKIDEMKRDLQARADELAEMRAAKEDAEDLATGQGGLLAKKEAEIARISSEKTASEARRNELADEVAELKGRVQSLEAEVGRQDRADLLEIGRIRAELEKAQQDLAAARDESGDKDTTIDGLNRKNSDLEGQIDRARRRIDDLERQVSRTATDVPAEVLQQNRAVLESLPLEGSATQETPCSLNPRAPLRPVSVATISLTPEGKIDQAQQRLLRLALTAELPQGFQDPKKENQVNLILAPEGILWHGPVDHLNGRQRTAVADLAKGMEKRLEQDPYTVAAKWGEGMGPLARDLYHAFRDSLRTLEENQSTRLTIVKQNGRHRAFHLSPNSPDYLAHIELLRSSSARIGLATVNVETPLEGAKVPYDQVSIILHLGELADAEPVRQAFLHMGRLLANRVSVNFVDGPSGGSGRPVGPSGGSIPPRPAPGSPKPAAPAPAPKPAVPKAPAQSAVRRRPSESEPLREREEPLQESDIVEDVPLEAIEQIPAAPRAPAEFTVGRASPPAGVPKTSSIPPPPRFRISAMQAATGTVKDLASSEIRMGQTGKGGAPAYFERIAEFGELGGATYEGIDYQAKGGNEDGIGRFFGPNKSLTVVISDGAGQHYGGREATELVLQTFARQVPHGKSVKEITPLVTRAIQRLEREQVNKEFNLQIPEGQTVKDFVEGLKAKKDPQNPDKQDAAAVELAYKIRHFAKKIDPQAAVAIARINRPDRPGQPYTLQPYWAGDAKIIVQRLVDGEWKLVWESVDHTMAQNIIGRLSEQDFRNYFGNIPRDLAVRLHDQNNVIINSFSKEGPGDRLATLEGGHSTDLAQTVTLPDGEQALVLRPGDRVIWATDGMTEGRGTTEQIVEMAALHKPGQNPAKAYLYNNVRRQTALKQARQAIEQKGESAEDDLRVPVILEEGRELWVNDRGAVYARESGGNAIDYLKSDNFGIQVLDFNPMDLKTAAQPAVPRSPLPQLPDLGKPRTPIPPPPRRSSPAAPRRRTPTEGFPSIPPLPPRTPRPSPPPLPAKALPLTTRKTGSPVPPPIPPAARVSKSPPPSRVPPTVPEGPRVKAVLPPPPMPPQAARTQVGVPVVPPPIPLSALADGPIAAGPISRRPTPPSMRPRQPQVLNMAPPAVEAFQSRPPLFEEGVFKVGDYSSLTVFLGKAPLWGKPGMSSHTADTYRIDLANSGVKSDTYATLVRVAPNVFNLTNNQKKHRIYVTGKGLSSPMEIAPGETKRVLVGQTIEIGSYQLPLAAFGS